MPISIPSGVQVSISGQTVSVKGPKGQLSFNAHAAVEVKNDNNTLVFAARGTEVGSKKYAGTARAVIANIVNGVSKGYEKKLQLVGVGYRASVQGKVLNLALGFSHPIAFAIPEGVTIETPSQTDIIVKGVDKQQVGLVAAKIRDYRPPEPYKGKGVRYSDERIVLKEAKKK
jgi:large subunit ribosomal protein L6